MVTARLDATSWRWRDQSIHILSKLPTSWLLELIKKYETVFTNHLPDKSTMYVEPVTFSLRNDIEIPNKNITAHLLQAKLRASADKLLDKLENGGLIKKGTKALKIPIKSLFQTKEIQ